MNPSAQDRTWIVLADSSRARIHVADEKLTRSKLMRELEHPESRVKGIDLNATERGRTSSRIRNVGGQRSAMEPHTDPREVEWSNFARELANELEHGRTHNAFDELIIVAPPQFLGQLRDAMTDHLHDMVRADVPKNLTQVEDRDVIERIKSEVYDTGRA